MVDRCGASLEVSADAAQLSDKLSGLRDCVIGFRILIESIDQLGVIQIVSSIFSEIAILIRIFFQVVVVISVLIHVIFLSVCILKNKTVYCLASSDEESGIR